MKVRLQVYKTGNLG